MSIVNTINSYKELTKTLETLCKILFYFYVIKNLNNTRILLANDPIKFPHLSLRKEELAIENVLTEREKEHINTLIIQAEPYMLLDWVEEDELQPYLAGFNFYLEEKSGYSDSINGPVLSCRWEVPTRDSYSEYDTDTLNMEIPVSFLENKELVSEFLTLGTSIRERLIEKKNKEETEKQKDRRYKAYLDLKKEFDS